LAVETFRITLLTGIKGQIKAVFTTQTINVSGTTASQTAVIALQTQFLIVVIVGST
jgi:hypothetical protein